MTLHHKNKIICIIDPLENELPEHFIDRCNFITSQNIKNDADYNKVINYSYIGSGKFSNDIGVLDLCWVLFI